MLCSRKSVALVVLIMLVSLAPAVAAIEGGNARVGKALAQEKCKPCHVQGAEGGTMTPLSKTQRQWERFYVKEKHQEVAPGTWDQISPDELKNIMQFMYNHAADSAQPQTCGR